MVYLAPEKFFSCLVFGDWDIQQVPNALAELKFGVCSHNDKRSKPCLETSAIKRHITIWLVGCRLGGWKDSMSWKMVPLGSVRGRHGLEINISWSRAAPLLSFFGSGITATTQATE